MRTAAGTAPRVRIVLPEALRELADGKAAVEIEVGEGGVTGVGRAVRASAADGLRTVGGVLSALRASHPGLHDRLATEQGALRPHVNVFVDGENIRFAGGLDTAVGAGSELFVLPAISGG